MSDEIRVEPNLSAWHVPEQRVIVKHTEKKREISLRAGGGPASTLTITSKPRSSQKRENALGELGLSSLSVRNWIIQSKETKLQLERMLKLALNNAFLLERARLMLYRDAILLSVR